MMNNMFSMFDPSSYKTAFSWMTILPVMVMTSKNKNQSMIYKNLMLLNLMKTFMKKEIKEIIKQKTKLMKENYTKAFLLILLMNILAIFPFNFTMTAQISMTLPISMTLWVSVMTYSIKNKFLKTISHLTPLGTPKQLMNFMVVIELVSNLIRPITLSVRLSANMIAGHLLMSLLSNFSMKSMSMTLLSMTPMMSLTILEMAVSLIQAYVFITLISLYQNENM